MNKKIRPLLLVLFITIFLISGCSRNYTIIKMDEVAINTPDIHYQKGKAVIIFFREKDKWPDYASVLNITNNNFELVGILANNTRLIYQVDPGKKVFMSAGFGSRTEFMDAKLKADHIYYVQIELWTNVWTFRHLFVPTPELDKDTEEIMQQTRLIKKNADSEIWVKQNMPSLLKRKATYETYVQEKSIVYLSKGKQLQKL